MQSEGKLSSITNSTATSNSELNNSSSSEISDLDLLDNEVDLQNNLNNLRNNIDTPEERLLSGVSSSSVISINEGKYIIL